MPATLQQNDVLPVKRASHSATDEGHGENMMVDGQPYVCIRNVDSMPPFLMSVVSNDDHWLFIASNTPFTAGRVDPDGALFPYQTVDKIMRHADTSGAISLFQVKCGGGWALWEPWRDGVRAHRLTRNLYKHVLGTTVIFEEINHDLGLNFRWSLATSETYGFVKQCRLENLAGHPVAVRCLDGLHQILPPGVSQDIYAKVSYLSAAYMRHECLPERAMGIYTMNSGITDRAEPCESLRAAAAWSVGHKDPVVLLSSRQIDAFRCGQEIVPENEVRGEFGAYLASASFELAPRTTHEWHVVADTGLDHPALVSLESELGDPSKIRKALVESVEANRRGLRKKIAGADGIQQTADRSIGVHHFANVLFNCMRGGTFENSYRFPASDFAMFLYSRNREVCRRHRPWLEVLPEELTLDELRRLAAEQNDIDLERLAGEYLPLTFSRRHGDPSRPWNRFTINIKDDAGNPIYGYQGNWRDIFQNWESLAQSYPACLESMIAVFLNSSTADGYNPYRISREGVDWELLDPSDPWSYIGYWGDHQIIYLLRLLESYERFEPGSLASKLGRKLFTYVQVPYEIEGFEHLSQDPRNSIKFRSDLHARLMERAAAIGNDGKLLAGADGEVLHVALAEKLLVPLLAKLSNLVPGGGIWMNTQRPEWNDANNALAGWGISMVTVFHIRRYLVFLEKLFANCKLDSVGVSAPVADFVSAVTQVLKDAVTGVTGGFNDATRRDLMAALGKAGEIHRRAVYSANYGSEKMLAVAAIRELLAAALPVIDNTIRANRRDDGMYHSYNLLTLSGNTASVNHLTVMLEGQVALLGSTCLSPVETLDLLKAMRASQLYRADQNSYILYPDRRILPLLSRNKLPDSAVKEAPVLAELVAANERSVVVADKNGVLHFQADLTNGPDLARHLDRLASSEKWREAIVRDRGAILDLWEKVFHHSAFTGRSGTMFGFEGLGCIYWHMVAKLLLSVQESYQHAVATKADASTRKELAAAYYEVRNGLGFTKSPQVYGAFPADPYSHTPRDRGAQQPGMTGQVKEEILTRMGELGVKVIDGRIHFSPTLLRISEFFKESHCFDFVDIDGCEQSWDLPAESLAFTFCQVPVAYVLSDSPSILLERNFNGVETIAGTTLPATDSRAIFHRTGEIRKLTIGIPRDICLI